jgi:SHAQKYF class myb-like DNA-binding protein
MKFKIPLSSTTTSNSINLCIDNLDCKNLNYDNKALKSNENKNLLNGKWSLEEHFNFILGVFKFGNDWNEIQNIIKTRSIEQCRSHSQKFFLKINRLHKKGRCLEVPINNLEFYQKRSLINQKELKELIERILKIDYENDLTDSDILIDKVFNFIGERITLNKSSVTDISMNLYHLSALDNFINYCQNFKYTINLSNYQLPMLKGNYMLK